MYHAAIVEDEPEILSHLKNTLANSFSERHINVAFDIFSSGLGFLSMFEEHYHYDMIFLDIEMPEIDGIEICRRIRKIAPESLVIFISNKDELVFQTFEVQPFRFIRKRHYHQQLPLLMDALILRLESQKKQVIQITEPISGDIYSFEIQQICYVEAQRKNCCIVTNTGTSVLRCKFMDIESQLLPYHFIKVHRSYLVNYRYIHYIGRTSLKLSNQMEIPISKSKLEDVKQQFLTFSTNQ